IGVGELGWSRAAGLCRWRRGAWVVLAVLGRADRWRRHRWTDRPLAARGIGARSKKTAVEAFALDCHVLQKIGSDRFDATKAGITVGQKQRPSDVPAWAR